MERGLLKQRIVGGLVLVALAVIVIPFVLDFGHEREWWGHRDNLSAPPEQGFVTRVLPLENWAQQADSELAAGMDTLDQPIVPPPSKPAPAPVTSPAAVTPVSPAVALKSPTPTITSPPSVIPASPPVSAVPAASAAGAGPWVVQLGSFSSKKNADDLGEFLSKRGFRAFVERNAPGGDAVYRVRIGPERERTRADALREQVERETQLRAIVLHYP
ncbi:MAG: SPOR domain-containing protein [Pseudomonadota bacterium]